MNDDVRGVDSSVLAQTQTHLASVLQHHADEADPMWHSLFAFADTLITWDSLQKQKIGAQYVKLGAAPRTPKEVAFAARELACRAARGMMNVLSFLLFIVFYCSFCCFRFVSFLCCFSLIIIRCKIVLHRMAFAMESTGTTCIDDSVVKGRT
jgi:hypothetical protein